MWGGGRPCTVSKNSTDGERAREAARCLDNSQAHLAEWVSHNRTQNSKKGREEMSGSRGDSRSLTRMLQVRPLTQA